METKNRWEDTGHDCPNCGGEILRRTDYLPDGSVSTYHQCPSCQAQWTPDWTPLREGFQRMLASGSGQKRVERLAHVPRWVWFTLLAMVFFILIRVGGGIVLRLLAVPLLIGITIWLIVRLGQDQGWWTF